MNDFRLTVFCSVAHNMSFTKAAHELGITQPAVSHHIQELEHELGMSLFDRQASGVQLTEAGSLLLHHAYKILECYRQLDFDIRLHGRGHGGVLRLGATTTIAQYILPSCMASFVSKYKNIKVSLIEGSSVEIEEAVAEGRIDLGMVEQPSRRQSLRYTPFMQDELLLVASARGNRVLHNVVTIDQLVALPLVLGDETTDSYKAVEQFFAMRQVPVSRLNVEMRINGNEAVKRYIAHADCMAFVSEQAFRHDAHVAEYKVVEIEGGRLVRQCSYVRDKVATKDVVRDFIDYMQDWLTRNE